MKNTNSRLIKFPVFATLLVFSILMISGCGSVKDKDFEPTSVQGYHPFETNRDHGAYVAQSIERLQECTECHGDDLHGVDNGVTFADGIKDRSCYKCHNAGNHPVEFVGESRDHTVHFQSNNWDMDACYTCHTNSSADGMLNLGGSCSSAQCHSGSPLGPQACNTCHGNPMGNANSPLSWAPPNDLHGNSDTGSSGVGAHDAHLVGNTGNAKAVACDICHNIPETWNENGHIVDNTAGRAEVAFHYPATKGSFEAEYDYQTNSCESVYCHGGNSANWTSTGNWNECNSCHGMPPGGTHPQWTTLEQCFLCHGNVIDHQGQIINPELHVNGTIND